MFVTCQECGRAYDDSVCWTICPHGPLEYPLQSYCERCDTLVERHGPCTHQIAAAVANGDPVVTHLHDELNALRRSHSNFLNKLRLTLGYNEWPPMEAAAFLDGVLDLVGKRLDAAQTLATKLRLIENDMDFQSVFTLFHVHGGVYQGPNWGIELLALESALQGTPRHEQAEAQS